MLEIKLEESALRPLDGTLQVRVFQDRAERDVLGDRDALRRAQQVDDVTESEVQTFEERLRLTREGELAVMSFHRGVQRNREALKRAASDRSIVTLGGISPEAHNLTIIASGGRVYEQAKTSLSSEDGDDGVIAGRVLHVFHNEDEPEAVRWAVVNCHEYTHADIMKILLERRIELLVVVTFNAATQLYWEYAIADVHRLFCFIIVVNVAELGGSAAFAPFRHLGNQRNATLRTAGQLFSTRGPFETTATVNLDIAELRRLRQLYGDEGLSGPKAMRSAKYLPLAPSEHFMHTYDREAGSPAVDEVVDVSLEWNGDDPTVAIVQLNSVPADQYVACRYRLDQLADTYKLARFEEGLKLHLSFLEQRLPVGANGRKVLDFLVLPEVFVSRRFAEQELVSFCERTNAVAICGVDYPGSTDEENRNSAWIMTGRGRIAEYDKVTRSQYDALADEVGGRMPLMRGRKLYRFTNSNADAFGVLICYDFSHFDLVHRINMEGRETPLDALFVIAHNPFGELYRTCCIADSHRFYQHVILSNVAPFGGSGILAPIRTEGARQTLVNLGIRNETISLTRLELSEQRAARAMDDTAIHEQAKTSGIMMRRPGIYSRRLC
ncbi:hypothetical protein V6R86_08410 [Sphingomonas kaistensis]|uniref:CN hydrolase domain-containing protein n=1 Tax=Sphingomonas kaistensis TaxID=298708 RepID=A0ABZ2G0R6_9SPHN